MGLLADVLNIITSQYGWVVVVLAFWYQLHWPLWETKVRSAASRIEDKIDDVDEKQLALTQVVRALARVNADERKQMDPDRVDNYLVENGVEPDEFIVEPSANRTNAYTAHNDDSDDDKGFQ